MPAFFMPKKKNKSEGAGKGLIAERELWDELQENLDASERQFDNIRDELDEKEALLIGELKDDISTSDNVKSQVFDPRLSTIAFERSARVMSKPPRGKIEGVSENDAGKNQLMNICVDNYVIPNSDTQFPYLLKSRMLDIYSMVYGVQFGLVDWRIDDRKGYYGPDWSLLPIRDCFPQAGKISVNDCERFQVSNLVTEDWLRQRDNNWNGIDELIKKLEDKGGKSRSDLDQSRKTEIQSKRHPDIDANEVEIITEYRVYGGSKDKGEWISYSPDLKNKILRRIDNPHDNGELPIFAKYCFPLLDSIYGLGEFERGKTLQYAINSLINLYLDGVKMSIFPPIMINPDGVVKSSIKMQSAAKWLLTLPDSIKQFNVNPQGMSTFNSTYSFLIAALLNQAGTTTTTTTAKVDPGMGKTPQALKMLEARESSRDSWDGFMMEQAQTEIMRKSVNLITKKQTKSIKMRLFEEEIKQIAEVYPDVLEYYDQSKNEVRVGSRVFSGMHFDYKVIPGTMSKVNEEQQFSSLVNLLQTVLQYPQLTQSLHERNKDIDIAEMLTRIVASSKLQDWDKIIVDLSPEKKKQLMAASVPTPQFQDEDIARASQDIQGIMGGVGGIPAQP